MSKQFVEGNVYVFVASKHKKDMDGIRGKSEFKKDRDLWAKNMNGREVRAENKHIGTTRGCGVFPEWCKCIKNNN